MNEEQSRLEHDTLGDVRVPAAAWWGAQTERARQNFPIGGGQIPAAVIRALGHLKGAAAAVHREAGRLDEDVARAIEDAAREVVEGRLADQFPVDVFQTGSGTSTNMNVNEVIANRAGVALGGVKGSGRVHPNDHVNNGQSSNDVFPSAVQVALALGTTRELLPEMRALAQALDALAEQNFDAVKTGRTHLMDAMPIRFGQVFRGYAQQVDRGADRIEAQLDGLCELPLGGTAVGTGLNAPAGFARAVCERLAKELDLPALRETTAHFQAQSSLDCVVSFHGALRSFATAFHKLANDLRWMASGPQNGLAEIRIPAVQPGSSIMPAKVNPVICESVLMLCVQVMANDHAVAVGNATGAFELNTMLPLIARNAEESVRILANGCRMFRTRLVEGLEVSDEPGKRVAANPILATALNGEIGYEAAAKIAKEAASSGRTVREVAAEQTDLPGERLDELLDPRRLCGGGDRNRV